MQQNWWWGWMMWLEEHWQRLRVRHEFLQRHHRDHDLCRGLVLREDCRCRVGVLRRDHHAD
jgi:hypothetical protein